MAKISAPVTNYNGTSAGVTFKDGVGHSDKQSNLDWFKSKGYSVEAEAPALAPQATQLPQEATLPIEAIKDATPEAPAEQEAPAEDAFNQFSDLTKTVSKLETPAARSHHPAKDKGGK